MVLIHKLGIPRGRNFNKSEQFHTYPATYTLYYVIFNFTIANDRKIWVISKYLQVKYNI